MTEAEWLECTDPQKMLEFLKGKASDRKMRLFACACYRRIWDRMHIFTQTVVEVAEAFADGLASEDDLDIAYCSAQEWPTHPSNEAMWVASKLAQEAASQSAHWIAQNVGLIQDPSGREVFREKFNDEARWQSATLRDIFGNPFRPVTVDPAWLTPGVVGLVRTIYDDRTFNRIPELPDALEESDCTDHDILGHLRGPGPHVRGCWLVDLCLSKS
jgi:hypothetical protein